MMLQPRLKADQLYAAVGDTPQELAEKSSRLLEDGADLLGPPQFQDGKWVQFLTRLTVVVPELVDPKVVPASNLVKPGA